jgi:hypothetical protein
MADLAARLAVVPFHGNFWLAASAAAPVITLATVVVIPDAAGIRFRAARRERELLDLADSTAFVTSEEVPPDPERTALERRLMRRR